MVLSPVNDMADQRVLPLAELKTKLTPQDGSGQPEAVNPPLLATVWSIKAKYLAFQSEYFCVSQYSLTVSQRL